MKLGSCKRTNTVRLHLHEVTFSTREVTFIETPRRTVVARGWGRGSYCSMDLEFQCGQMRKVLETDGSDGCTAVWMYLMPLNYLLKSSCSGKLSKFYTLYRNFKKRGLPVTLSHEEVLGLVLSAWLPWSKATALL